MFCYLKSDFRFIYLIVCSLSRLFKDPNKPSAHIEGANKGDVTYQVNKGIGHNSDIFVYGCYDFTLFLSLSIFSSLYELDADINQLSGYWSGNE